MPISSITTNDTFGLLVTRTSQLITAYNSLEANGALVSIQTAQTAYGQANTATTIGSAAFGKANSANIVGSLGFDKANSANVLANSAYTFANTLPANITAAFAQANTAYTAANSAAAAATPGFNQANTATTIASAAFGAANTAATIGSSAFGAANAAFGKANTAGSNTAPGILQLANVYNYRQKTNSALALGIVDAWTAANTVALPANLTVYIDFASGFNFNVTLNSATTLVPQNVVVGQSGFIRLKQNASGGSIISYNSLFKFANNAAPSNSTGANAEDVLFYQAIEPARVFASLVKAIP